VAVLLRVYYSLQLFFLAAEFTKIYMGKFGSRLVAKLELHAPKPESVIVFAFLGPLDFWATPLFSATAATIRSLTPPHPASRLRGSRWPTRFSFQTRKLRRVRSAPPGKVRWRVCLKWSFPLQFLRP